MSIKNTDPLPVNTVRAWKKINDKWQIVPKDEEYQEAWKERENPKGRKPEKGIIIFNPATKKIIITQNPNALSAGDF